MRQFKALFLDLDGTLLDIDMAFFLGPMVARMHDFFSDVLGREIFREGLFAGTEALMADPRPPGETNEERFFRVFSGITGLNSAEARGRFGDFYDRAFPSLGSFARPVDGAPEFVSAARDRGYFVVLATNPIFPVRASVERVRWAGIDPGCFQFVPGLENMTSCKPSTRYFLDLASRLGVSPEVCLMIGNDLEQDLPAGDVGMGTFLVEGRVIGRPTGGRKPDARGSLKELAGRLGIKMSKGKCPASSVSKGLPGTGPV